MVQFGNLILISIHAPREGGDPAAALRGGGAADISIHAPREGGDYNQKEE